MERGATVSYDHDGTSQTPVLSEGDTTESEIELDDEIGIGDRFVTGSGVLLREFADLGSGEQHRVRETQFLTSVTTAITGSTLASVIADVDSILVVHSCGRPAKNRAFAGPAVGLEISLAETCGRAHDERHGTDRADGVDRVVCFSCDPPKNATATQDGAVMLDRQNVATRLGRFVGHDRSVDDQHRTTANRHATVGRTFRPANTVAEAGRVKLEPPPTPIDRRRRNAARSDGGPVVSDRTPSRIHSHATRLPPVHYHPWSYSPVHTPLETQRRNGRLRSAAYPRTIRLRRRHRSCNGGERRQCRGVSGRSTSA